MATTHEPIYSGEITYALGRIHGHLEAGNYATALKQIRELANEIISRTTVVKAAEAQPGDGSHPSPESAWRKPLLEES